MFNSVLGYLSTPVVSDLLSPEEMEILGRCGGLDDLNSVSL